MTPLRKRFYEDMQLHGLAARTQESYVQAVQGLARHYKRSPDLLSDEEIRGFFLHSITSRPTPLSAGCQIWSLGLHNEKRASSLF